MTSQRGTSWESGRAPSTRSIDCRRRRDQTSKCRRRRDRSDTAARWRPRWRRARRSVSDPHSSAPSAATTTAGRCATRWRRGVNATHLIPRRAPSSRAILVDERTGDRTVLWERDARLSLDAETIPRTSSLVPACCTWTIWTRTRQSRRRTIGRAAGIPVTSDIDRVTAGSTEALSPRRFSRSTCRPR